MKECLKQIAELKNEANAEETVWLRHVLTLAAGALAVLAGLAPEAQGIARYFLLGTWVGLGAGIASGAAAAYVQVAGTRQAVDHLADILTKSAPENARLPILTGVPPPWWAAPCKRLMVISFLIAVICLTISASLTTLNGISDAGPTP